jgi:enolase
LNPKPKPQELAEVYKRFTAEFPVVTIEDPFDQDDWESYTKLTEVIVGCVCVCVSVCESCTKLTEVIVGCVCVCVCVYVCVCVSVSHVPS